MSEQRRGLLFGLLAYTLWGVFPLYWPLLEPAGAVEILAHRIVWSLVAVGLLLVLGRRRASLGRLLRDNRARSALMMAAVLIAVNWGTYIWGVNNHRVVETSLGYFINPLVTVLLGVVVLHERLRRLQWGAVALAGVAVLALAVDYGRPPWVALTLAFSFGLYGLAKKQAASGAVAGMTLETALLAPVALGYLVVLELVSTPSFGHTGTGEALLLVSAGLVTAVPLLAFAGAATRMPLTTIGLLQYLAPTIQFLIGVLVLGEPMPASRLAGFALVWVALAVFTADAIVHRRRQLRLLAASLPR